MHLSTFFVIDARVNFIYDTIWYFPWTMFSIMLLC